MDTTTGAARETALEKAFAEGGMNVGGLTLRPFSLGTLSFCRQMKLTAFTGALDDAPEGEVPNNVEVEPGLLPGSVGRKILPKPVEAWSMEFQLTAFAWLQSAPLPEVKAAVREGRWEQEVEDFSFGLSMEELPLLLAEVERIAKLAEAAAVQVKPKPGTGEKGAPKN